MSAPRGRGERAGDRLLAAGLGALLLFSLVPLAVLAVFSLNDFPYFSLPFRGVTTHWYDDLLANEEIGDSLGVSAGIALVTAVVATLLGATFAIGGARVTRRGGRLAMGAGLLPLVTPALVLAIGAQLLYVQAGVPLSRATVVATQATAFAPFVVLMVAARLSNFEWNLLHAARDLGAGPWRAFVAAMLPAIRPGLVSGFLIAALMSFSDFILGFFTGRGFVTLPSLIYSMQRVGISPMLLAYSTVVVAAAALVSFAGRGALVTVTKRRGGADA